MIASLEDEKSSGCCIFSGVVTPRYQSHMKHIAVICNPIPEAAAKVHQLADAITVGLYRRAIMHQVFTQYWPDDWRAFTEIWIIGGDGTLNYFINHYPDVSLPIAVFKGGSGNDFHWMLYRDLSTEQQIEKVLNGSPTAIDLGICNGQYFLNGVGIGFDGAIVKDLLGKKKVAGKASYLLSILKHVVGYGEKPCAIELGGLTFSQSCFMISVANGQRYGGGFKVAPKASLSDGLLDVSIVGKIPPLMRLKYLPVIEKGEHLALPFIKYHQAEALRFTSPVFWHAHMDGEYLSADQFDIRINKKKIFFLT